MAVTAATGPVAALGAAAVDLELQNQNSRYKATLHVQWWQRL